MHRTPGRGRGPERAGLHRYSNSSSKYFSEYSISWAVMMLRARGERVRALHGSRERARGVSAACRGKATSGPRTSKKRGPRMEKLRTHVHTDACPHERRGCATCITLHINHGAPRAEPEDRLAHEEVICDPFMGLAHRKRPVRGVPRGQGHKQLVAMRKITYLTDDTHTPKSQAVEARSRRPVEPLIPGLKPRAKLLTKSPVRKRSTS